MELERNVDCANPINWGAPGNIGLRSHYQVLPGLASGGLFRDFCRRYDGVFVNTGNTFDSSQTAIDFQASDVASRVDVGSLGYTVNSPYTITIRFQPDSVGGSARIVSDTGDSNNLSLATGVNGSGMLDIWPISGSWATVKTGILIGQWYTYSLVNHPRGDSTCDSYVDGKLMVSHGAGIKLNATGLGARLQLLYGPVFDGRISTFIVHDRVLNASEIETLHQEINIGYPTLLNHITTLRYFPMGAAAAATLDGACAIVFTGTNILTGAGALAGASALIFSGTNALSGAGALLGASALIFAGTNTLDGAGALLGSSALIFSGTNTLTGAGALVGSSAVAFSGTNILDGAGALVGSSACIFSGTNTLTGAGALLGTSVVVFTGTDTLVGAGALSGDLAVVFTPTGTLTLPSGGMAGVSAIVFTGTDTLLGAGVLAGASAVVFTGTNTLSGAGSLLGASAVVFGGTATLGGGVGLFGVVTLAFSGTDTLQGSGTLAGAAASVFTLTGNLATGSLLGLSTLVFTASSNLSGNGALLGVLPLVFSAITTSTFPVEFIDIEHAYLEVPGVTRFSEALGTSGYMRPY